MKNDPLLFFRVAAAIVCFLTVIAGIALMQNIDRILPANSETAGENDSQRSYAGFLLFAVWAHAFVLSGSFAMLLH
ncbi:MAG: hypothetical protein QOD99_1889 [Chthoniobacter sp.]|jgi:hypothetical protein|nr:hypothetical protein [Chthoniobacter sp.]